jgi:zinc transporter ZupT
MNPGLLLLIGLATVLTTFLGGALALRLRDKLHLILGFSAGAVIALAFFDLIPESIELGMQYFEVHTLLTFTALGFFVYTVLDRFIMLHTHANDEGSHVHHSHRRGFVSAGSLASHSFLDGFAIGLAFQASTAIGIVVAVAVLVHDFSDGVNTVNVVLKNGGDRLLAMKWLMVDAIAPLLGLIATFFITVEEQWLSLLLATFAGFFLYIGASDLLPESHHKHPKALTTVLTLLGAGVMYLAIHLAHG